MSALRARCPACRTLTAVAVGDDYECHSCGATFAAGIVRVIGVPSLEPEDHHHCPVEVRGSGRRRAQS